MTGTNVAMHLISQGFEGFSWPLRGGGCCGVVGVVGWWVLWGGDPPTSRAVLSSLQGWVVWCGLDSGVSGLVVGSLRCPLWVSTAQKGGRVPPRMLVCGGKGHSTRVMLDRVV